MQGMNDLKSPAAISLLSVFFLGTDSGCCQEMKHANLLESLRFRVALLEQKLTREPQWDELRRLRAEVSEQVPWLLPCPEGAWDFTQHALLLLLSLKRSMDLLAAAYSPPPPNPRTAEAAPPLRPDTLSIAQERTVQAALQAVVAVGLCPYLSPGVGLPLSRRTEFSALVQAVAASGGPSQAPRKLFTTCIGLLEIAQHPALGGLILTQHLGDLLAGLCQLGFCPVRKKSEEAKMPEERAGLPEEERTRCKEALRGLLDRVYQPLVVRELLLLQGGPKQGACSNRRGSEQCLAPAPAWLRRLCGQLLSERLMRPNGVQAVVRGILEGAGAGAVGGSGAEAAAADWQKCDAVARILSSCPQQSLSLEDYYRQVCPQVLQLFLLQDKLAARQFQRVATATVLGMARQCPRQAEKHLLRPMLGPLLRCLEAAETSLDDLPAGTVLVEEEELSSCVETVFKVYVVGNEPVPVLMEALQLALGVLFSLWCFARQNVSFLRTPCQEILLWFLEKSERKVALGVLGGLAQLGGAPRPPHPRCRFQAADEGGAMATITEAASDEDEALYEKVSSEQRQLEQLVELLSHCQSSGLAGEFFLSCLKELTGVAEHALGTEEPGPAGPASPLDLERSCGRPAEEQERRLRVLQLLALLCEGVSDTLLTDIAQVVEFVAATLQRARTSFGSSSGGAVEAQTLSMAMGLVAALLGGAAQLKPADLAALQQLVPLLEEVSRLHPEPVIQELAADLRIAICTRGAFATEAVCSAARGTLGLGRARGLGQAGTGVSRGATASAQGGGPKPEGALQQASREHSSPAEPNVAAPEDQAAAPSAEPHLGSPARQSLRELLASAYDPDVPARAAALRSLARLIERRDPGALEVQEQLLKVFMENLEHEDSFVYLSAIQGVALLSDVLPTRVLHCLLAQFGGVQPSARKALSAETRMKVGEALMRITRALGDLVFPHRDGLIHAFLRGARDPDSTLRASSLSNLGELCQTLGFQLGSVVHEVTSCLSAVVKTDREAEVRRAAVHVVVLLLRGLSERAVEVLRDVLLELYRLLKWVVRCERDEVAVLHAQLALQELDDVTRRFLFPRQSLEKKIQVLP
ncbi:transport and Golgi organization protein 6 homolog isoform X1 [Varanus komodoensis]|uniref:transport and Golgi organization protein 6 homolog isoform X1 n=1 Tax=Varanus komodoensis TaxID=61221 RepID=UPI001CF7E05B|nr:transport and Golgi organization protein 6 homolog isoform X1 [Varanus komodoensis]XP_044283547.1 transport and Golgi organization protein 6 homolog isoform X1 [Varanus komodoensis]